MVFPHLSLLVHFENSARENDLNSSLESIIYKFWSLKHELQAVPTKYDSSTDLGHCAVGVLNNCNKDTNCNQVTPVQQVIEEVFLVSGYCRPSLWCCCCYSSVLWASACVLHHPLFIRRILGLGLLLFLNRGADKFVWRNVNCHYLISWLRPFPGD